MKRTLFYKMLLISLVLLMGGQMYAQCKIENKYFKEGEDLKYDLYFKYGILFTQAGEARLKTDLTTYESESAYKVQMESVSSGVARRLFSMNDTLSGVLSKELVPLEFNKDAHETGDYTKERIKYTYLGDNKIKINTKRDRNGEFKFDETLTTDQCIYDMLSVVFYSRTLDYSSMKEGDHVGIDFMAGKRKVHMVIEHHGFEKIKGNDKKKYQCIKLVLNISNASSNAFGDKNKEEAMKVYLSNDANRIPIRMDFKLKIGSARALINSTSGLKNKVD